MLSLQELLHGRREAHAALSAMLLEHQVVSGSELASMVEQYPASGAAPSLPDDVVRQLVRGDFGDLYTHEACVQEGALEVASQP